MQPALALCCVFALLGAPLAVSAEKAEIIPSKLKHRHHKPLEPSANPSQLVLAQAGEAATGAVAADAATTALPVVPKPVNVGPDGFPQLPAVSTMLGTASETLKSINSQASVLEARVVQAQMENEAKMARQKAVFEQKLRRQEQQNRAVVSANAKISKEIAAVKANNTALRKHANELQQGNKLRRTELRVLLSKLDVAREFLGSSLTHTDDSKAPELTVFQAPKAPRRKAHHRQTLVEFGAQPAGNEVDRAEDDAHEQDDEDEDDDEDDGKGTSLLSLAARVRRAATARSSEASEVQVPPMTDAEAVAAAPQQPADVNPRDLIVVLSKGVTDLQKEEKESESRLKAMFLSNFRAGTQRHAALMAQQRTLNSTRTSLLDLQGKLRAADAHLEGTRAHLEQRLRAFGLFVQRLAHLALAPAGEVPNLLKAMPAGVAFPLKPQQ